AHSVPCWPQSSADLIHLIHQRRVAQADSTRAVGNRPEVRPEAWRLAPENQARKLPGQGSGCHNHNSGMEEGRHQGSLSHVLPTSCHVRGIEDPDLALIVGIWDRLPDECKHRLIEMVKAELPEAIKAGIVAMIKASTESRDK